MLARRFASFAFILAALFAHPEPSSAQEPIRPGQESFISSGVFSDGKLWLRSDSGQVWSLKEDAEGKVLADLPDTALALWKESDRPATLTCPRTDCSSWALRNYVDGQWTKVLDIPSEGEALVGAGSADGKSIILTSARLIEIEAGKMRHVPLVGKLREAPSIPSNPFMYVTAQSVYLGLNLGEWGGGLRRIDRKSGLLEIVERSTGDLCSGPLNTDCDPVHGIVTLPWKPDCVAVAIGLVHMLAHGRITEVCPDKISTLYFKGFGPGRLFVPEKPGEEPYSTVPFFGLINDGTSVWAVGLGGLYHFNATGLIKIIPIDTFKNVGGIGVNFELPGVIVVLTEISSRTSVSGRLPMLVPRQ